MVEDRLRSLVLAVQLNDFAAAVRGSIIEDDEFDVLESLGQNAGDAFWQVLGVIIVRRDDRDLGTLRVPGGVKQRGQNLIDGDKAQIQGQIAGRPCVSKDTAIPRVGIESGVGHVIIPRQVTPQEDDSMSLDRVSQVGRPAVDADEERSSADDLGRFSDACLAAQIAVVFIIVTAKGRAKSKLNDAQSVHTVDVIDEAIPVRGLPVPQTVFGGGVDANVAVWKLETVDPAGDLPADRHFGVPFVKRAPGGP